MGNFRWMWFDTDQARVAIMIHPDGLEMSAEDLALVFRRGMGRHKKPTTVLVMDNKRPFNGETVFVHQVIGDGAGGLCLSEIAHPWAASTLGNLLETRSGDIPKR